MQTQSISRPKARKKKASRPKMRWVSLHNHTTFSYGDGYRTPHQHCARVEELRGWAISATEHGNTSSHAQLEKAAEKFKLKPIYGCEIYTAPTDPENTWVSEKTRKKWHQTILAMNDEGYRNLNRLVSASWRDNFFQWPTTSAEMLETFSDGLIVLSGCSDSFLNCTLLGGKSMGDKRLEYSEEDFENALAVVEHYKSIFGDRYYLEVQRFPKLERTCVLNKALAKISRMTGVRMVATADVHYPYPDDNVMQRILHAAHRGGTVETVDADWEYDVLLTYPLNDQEIVRDLRKTGLTRQEALDAVEETVKIANRCNVVLPKNEPIRFPYPGSGLLGSDRTNGVKKGEIEEFDSIEDYIWEQLRRGWDFRSERNPDMNSSEERRQEYIDRLKFEMELIISKDFCHYFAMLSDAVIWAKEQKIAVGPARGSAAASLACWLLRITEIDPMQFPHMLFSRFIDPNRLDLPDVDLDFDDERRDEVRLYLVSLYGADRVGNIGNFTRYRGKNSIDDVARVYNIPKWEADTVKNLIVERSGGDARQSESLSDTFEMFPKARDVLSRHPNLELATRLEGNYRGLGVHAAGLVISNAPISDTCAIYTRTKDGRTVQVVAYDKKDAEYVGMLKADFLGLKTMGMIGLALDTIQMDLEDLYAIPITEPKVLRAFADNDLTGIFQFEGRATQIVNADVHPDHFGHLADINALSRPGPLFSGMTAQYTAVKHGRVPVEKLHPVVDALTDWTYGQIVYQEQVLSILAQLAGFPAVRVGDIRRIISQKLGQMVMENAYQEFEDGCRKMHGIDPKLARRIWNFIATSSTYSFNQSHSVSYALLGFWCMWLKMYHPTAFYAAQLTKVGDGKDNLYKRGKLMQDAIRHDVSITAPDLNLSTDRWVADVPTKRVIAGFRQVHGIGPVTAKNILEWREDELRARQLTADSKKPLEWGDLIAVHGIGPATIKKIVEFSEKDDPFDINLVAKVLGHYRQLIRSAAPGGYCRLPTPTHHSTEMPPNGKHRVVWIGLPRSKNYKDYIEATRTRTGKDVEEILATMKDPHLVKSCVVQAYDEGDEDVYLRFGRWDFPKMEAMLEDLATDGSDILVVVGDKKEDFGISIHVKRMFKITIEETESEDADDPEAGAQTYLDR